MLGNPRPPQVNYGRRHLDLQKLQGNSVPCLPMKHISNQWPGPRETADVLAGRFPLPASTCPRRGTPTDHDTYREVRLAERRQAARPALPRHLNIYCLRMSQQRVAMLQRRAQTAKQAKDPTLVSDESCLAGSTLANHIVKYHASKCVGHPGCGVCTYILAHTNIFSLSC